jgi:hypothetical protein
LHGFAPAAAQLVEEEVARDVKEKRGERGAALVAGGGPVEAHEDLEGLARMRGLRDQVRQMREMFL